MRRTCEFIAASAVLIGTSGCGADSPAMPDRPGVGEGSTSSAGTADVTDSDRSDTPTAGTAPSGAGPTASPTSTSAGESSGSDTTGTTTGGAHVPSYEALRNTDPLFRRHEDASQLEVDALSFFHDDFTMPITPVDQGPGPGGQGQFRLGCQYSHFALDDPIVFPGEPGASHLHMFWGNTQTDAFTSFDPDAAADDMSDVRQRGGGTCQGFELNRSAYWTPAVLDRSGETPHLIVPDTIILYYKSHRPQDVNPLPAGVELLAGNLSPDGAVQSDFEWSHELFWSCGNNGDVQPGSQRASIPTDCAAGQPINATIAFPQCLAVDGAGAPVLRSDNHVDHTSYVLNTEPCPATHPYRVPQISYLLYFPNGSDGAGAGVEDWRLASDTDTAGGSLHGDWLGGWNDDALVRWIDGCFDPGGAFSGPRNCSLGQTGSNGTGRAFHRVSPLNDYTGENFLLDPWPEHSAGHHE